MKHPITATIITFGLACVAGASVAQDQSRTTNLQNVTVTGTPAPYETYVVEVTPDYGLQVLVGNTRSHYIQAQRAADGWESMRMQGAALKPYVAVAIDNSAGPGTARQIQLSDSGNNTIAIVNVYCKGFVAAGTDHCKLALVPSSTNTFGRRVASTLSVTTSDVGG
jgi:hypothetical protein